MGLTVSANSVRSLSIVLQDVEVVLSEQQLTSQQKVDLDIIAESCREVLNNVERTLGKYHELGSASEEVGNRARKAWKRFKWEPDEIRELRSRITSNITLLNAFNGHLTRNNTVQLLRQHDFHERRTILDWLTPFDYGTQQSDFIGRRQEGTGRWLLESDAFQTWVEGSELTLFCSGAPGAGKTIITSMVVDNLCARYQNDGGVGIAYIYCNFRRQQQQKPTDLLASLVKQLAQRRPSMPGCVETLYQRHYRERTRPSLEEVSKVLHAVVMDYSKTFIVIDALDECQTSDGGRRKLLSEIFNLQGSKRVCLFATSRCIPEVEKEFEGSVSIEIRASDDDVQRYLDSYMSQLPLCVSRSSELQEEIKTEIMKAVDGMFVPPPSKFDVGNRLTIFLGFSSHNFIWIH
jgi:Cdc6-like AAA superfamily ATPase